MTSGNHSLWSRGARFLSYSPGENTWTSVPMFALGIYLFTFCAQGYMFFITGATYWFDSIVYVELAQALSSVDGLREFYSSNAGVLYQHVPPGTSFVFAVFEYLFEEDAWYGIAVFQRVSAAVATAYFALSFRGRLSAVSIVLLSAVISTFPYFSSFHNAILTESLASSLLMVAVGSAVRSVASDGQVRLRLGLILGCGVLLTQFRIYLAVGSFLTVLLVVLPFARSERMKYFAAITGIALLSVFSFPLYRASVIGELYLPNVDLLEVTHASYVNWDLNADLRRLIRTVVVDEDIMARLASDDRVDYGDAKKIYANLISAGYSSVDVKKMVKRVGRSIRLDGSIVVLRQLQLNLSSLGLHRLSVCCDAERVVRRGITASKYLKTNLDHYYLWFSQVHPNDYKAVFDSFSARYRLQPDVYSPSAVTNYVARVRPYVTNQYKGSRDPLKLSSIPVDGFALLGLLGIGVALVRTPMLGVIIIVPVLVVYASTLVGVVVGSTRYAHPLFPIYFASGLLLAETVLRRGVVQFGRRKTSASRLVD